MSKIFNLKRKFAEKKHKMLIKYGIAKGLVGIYSDSLIERMGKVYYGALPASLILLTEHMVQGHCYDRACLITSAFSEDADYEIVYAAVDGIKYNPKYEQKHSKMNKQQLNDAADHGYVVLNENGTKWVYDTSSGLVMEQHLYNLIERPVVRFRRRKEEIIEYNKKNGVTDSISDDDKYVLPLIIPNLKYASSTNLLYERQKEEQLNKFLDEIGYDTICEEFEKDMHEKMPGTKNIHI